MQFLIAILCYFVASAVFVDKFLNVLKSRLFVCVYDAILIAKKKISLSISINHLMSVINV